jgi:hypothetical protein
VSDVDSSFRAKDTDWHKGLSVVLIAGCSVFDVTGDKCPTAERNLAPGRKWATTGPGLFLGYEWTAPGDRFFHWRQGSFEDAGPKQVVVKWVEQMETYWDSPLWAWMYANWCYEVAVNRNCHNACAINATSSPKTAYHLTGSLGVDFLWSIESKSEGSWAGE